jgi:hypothetical protein
MRIVLDLQGAQSESSRFRGVSGTLSRLLKPLLGRQSITKFGSRSAGDSRKRGGRVCRPLQLASLDFRAGSRPHPVFAPGDFISHLRRLIVPTTATSNPLSGQISYWQTRNRPGGKRSNCWELHRGGYNGRRRAAESFRIGSQTTSESRREVISR